MQRQLQWLLPIFLHSRVLVGLLDVMLERQFRWR